MAIIVKVVSEVYLASGQIPMWFALHILHFGITFQRTSTWNYLSAKRQAESALLCCATEVLIV